MSYPNLSLFLVALIFVCFARASESKDAAPENVNYSGKQNQEWEKMQAQLAAQKTKLDAQEAVVKALIAEKSGLSGQALTTKVNQLKSEYTKLRTMTDEYNKLSNDYETQFPERGLKEKRIYTRIRQRTLKSYEDDQSVRGRVNTVHKKILKQYGEAAARAASGDKTPARPSSSRVKKSAEPASQDVTDTIQLKK